MSVDDPAGASSGPDPNPARYILLGMAILVIAGAVAFSLLRRPIGPPPAAIAGDPLLVEGREIYLSRCVSCHGPNGRGDGPIAKGLTGPPPRDLTSAEWKHGDRPEQVLQVVIQGVKDTSMPGWKGTLSASELKAVSAYVFYLAGRTVPDEFREP